MGDLNPQGGMNPINVQRDNPLPILDIVNAQRVQECQYGQIGQGQLENNNIFLHDS